MDKLRSMAVYVSVVEKGSFAAAAEEWDMSATMAANHVRSLEDSLGARLIDRTTRRHALTEIGQAYYERCRDALGRVADADAVAEQLRAAPSGTLRISAPVTWGTHRLMPVLAAYMARYPAVRVELNLDDRVVDLGKARIDIAIRSGPLRDDSLVARPLAPSQMWAAASPAYLRRHGHPRHPSDLEKHLRIGFAAWGPRAQWRFTRGEDAVDVPVDGHFVSNNGPAALVAALHGLGVIVQADVMLEPALAEGALVRLLPDWELPTRQLHLVRPPDVTPTAKVRSVVDFLTGRLGPATGKKKIRRGFPG